MAIFKALLLASAALVASSALGAAADLMSPPPAAQPPVAIAPAPVDFGPGSGWYLRGDVGIGASANTPTMVDSINNLAGLSGAAFENFSNTSLSAAGLIDVGVGYQLNSWLRGDVTAEYRGGSHFQSLYNLNDPGKLQYADFYRGDMSSIVGLVNGYADLGTWSGITPYLGAGVGVARNTVSGFTDQGFGYVGNVGTGPAGGYFSDKSKVNFAWALMAGVGLDITQNVKLDLGYRYLNLGKMQTGLSNCLNGTGSGSGFSCTGHSLSSSNTLASNDFRIGLRWMLSDVGAPAPQPLPPLVRKY